MPKRSHGAFILARYSTDNQNPDSIEVQVNKCTEWCQKNNMPILGVYADFATSGMKDTRPQYEAMMQQLRQGGADTVVIYDQSRMFRKMTAWFAFRDELTAMRVSVVAVTQPTIGKDLRDPTNFVTEGSMALFNQMHALITRQKVMEKMRFMARNGQHTGGMAPLGYKIEDGRLVICEEEAVVVRRIFSEYANGKSYKNIIDGLNADGIKTKRGNPFGSNSLHDLLHNEKYIGTIVYGLRPFREDGTRNTHLKDGTDVIRLEDAMPAIIDKETFQIVQERMTLNKRIQGGRPSKKRDYPLRSKVFCADCKSAMTVSTSQQKYDYYRCTGKKRLHNCDASPISVDELERAVADGIRQILGSPDNVDGLIRIMRNQSEQIHSGAVAQLQMLIDQDRDISAKLENAIDAILNGMASPLLQQRITDLETQKADISRKIRQLKADVDAAAIPEAELRAILDLILSTTSDDIRVLLSIVYRVEVGKEEITIWTLLNADPNGTIDHTQEGVTITSQNPSGVPKENNPNQIFQIGKGFGLFVYFTFYEYAVNELCQFSGSLFQPIDFGFVGFCPGQLPDFPQSLLHFIHHGNIVPIILQDFLFLRCFGINIKRVGKQMPGGHTMCAGIFMQQIIRKIIFSSGHLEFPVHIKRKCIIKIFLDIIEKVCYTVCKASRCKGNTGSVGDLRRRGAYFFAFTA